MSFLSKIAEKVKKIFNKINEAKKTLAEYVEENKEQIAKIMGVTSVVYKAIKGSDRMKAVISYFINSINKECGTSFNSEQIGTSATVQLEEEFQEVYDSIKA